MGRSLTDMCENADFAYPTEFKFADVATNSEVSLVLQHLLQRDAGVALGAHRITSKARPVVQQASEYAKRFAQIESIEANDKVKR